MSYSCHLFPFCFVLIKYGRWLALWAKLDRILNSAILWLGRQLCGPNLIIENSESTDCFNSWDLEASTPCHVPSLFAVNKNFQQVYMHSITHICPVEHHPYAAIIFIWCVWHWEGLSFYILRALSTNDLLEPGPSNVCHFSCRVSLCYAWLAMISSWQLAKIRLPWVSP